MRIRVGRIVDTTKDINLVDLSPMDRIIASVINAYHSTSMYRRRFAETEEKREEQRRRVRETLTDSLLAVITPELEGNKTLEPLGDKCRAMLIKVPSRYKSYLSDVIKSHEFDAYDTKIISPIKDISKFCEPSYLLYVENKGGC